MQDSTHSAHRLHRRPLSAPRSIASGSIAFWLIASGCSVFEPPAPEPPATFPIALEVRGGEEPLPGAQVTENHRLLGTTGAAGTLQLALDGSEGDTIALVVKCPEGFASPAQPLRIGLRRLAPGSPAPRFDVDCVELSHTLVAGVRAENGARLPILHLNEVIGHTDAHGVAHVQLETSDAQSVTLTLDTRARPDLLPQNPALTFIAPETDALVLLEQKFAIKKAPPRRRAVVALPTRIGS